MFVIRALLVRFGSTLSMICRIASWQLPQPPPALV